MPNTQPLPATDSARELHGVIGDDATATFENDPTFIDSNPTADGSSENLQEPADREAYLASPAKPSLDEEEEDDDDDEELEADDDYEDEDDEDEDDEDDDFEDDDDEEYEDDEDEDDDEDEEDDDEVEELEAAPASLRADGLLGYEDEAEDVKAGRTRQQGDNARAARADDLYQDKDGDAPTPFDEASEESGEVFIPPVHGALSRFADANMLAARMRVQAMAQSIGYMAGH